MGFKAECQGTRSSLILEDENYSIKEDVAHAKYKFQELMSECGKQVQACAKLFSCTDFHDRKILSWV